MSICDMCHKDFSKDSFTSTGYFAINNETFHICTACGNKIKDYINNYDNKYLSEK